MTTLTEEAPAVDVRALAEILFDLGPDDDKEPHVGFARADDRKRPTGPAVLVVEDTPVNQAITVRMLENCGFEAHVTSDGREALELLGEHCFAAVLMDCLMPELDGYGATREIRRREQGGHRLPVIALTTASSPGDRVRCVEAGMDDFLAKPLRGGQLADTLRRWVPASGQGGGPSPLEQVAGPARDELLLEPVVAELEALDEGETLQELLTLFRSESTGDVAGIDAAVQRGDRAAVRELAHRFRGSCCALGASGASRILMAIERTASDGELAEAGLLLRDLRDVLEVTWLAFDRRLSRCVGVARCA